MSILQIQRVAGDAQISAGEMPRRRIDRETTPGRCGNLDYCSIGMQRVQVRVPISEPFVCPECGGRLRPPGRLGGGRRPWLLPAVRVTVLVGCMGAALAIGYAVGRVQPAVHKVVQQAARGAGAGLKSAGNALGLGDQPPPKPAPVVPPAPRAPLPVFVGDRPYPSRALAVDVTNPATHLAREARFGEVTIDCTLEAALTHPTCHVTDIRGADAFSAAAITFLQSQAVQYAPSTRTGAPTLLDHRWRVVFQDFSGVPDAEASH
jgi:hypothetical protein